MKQYYFEDLVPGTSESITRRITAPLIEAFADVSGDNNPLHLDEVYAASTRFGGRIAHGALVTSLISAVLGTKLPGLGTVYLSQTTKFIAPVKIDDEVVTTVTVVSRSDQKNKVTLRTECEVRCSLVATGEAVVFVPNRP